MQIVKKMEKDLDDEYAMVYHMNKRKICKRLKWWSAHNWGVKRVHGWGEQLDAEIKKKKKRITDSFRLWKSKNLKVKIF